MKLYGAILGDIMGQPYEYKYKGNFSELKWHDDKGHFTDDTIMTIAVAAKLLGYYNTYEEAFKDFGKRYDGDTNDFYGKGFKTWLKTPIGTTGDSWANGSLMKLSPIMYNFYTN